MPAVSIEESDYARLVAERDHLRAQVAELQNESSKRAEASLARTVRAFHFRFGHPVAWKPDVPSADMVRFRAKLVTEEFFELLRALFPGAPLAKQSTLWPLIETASLDVNLPELVDAMADLAYVVEGTAAVFGVHMPPIAAAVHAANMAKDPNGADGKPVKPEGWKSPDIRGLLMEQGWQP
jgi:predicted HAD superfamily Cof-like phosphohydrolase